jgi:flavin-binding protein dodecin
MAKPPSRDRGRLGTPTLARDRRRCAVADHTETTYRLTEIVGTSRESIHQAVRNGIARAAETVRHLDWFEITEIRGTVVDGDVGTFQVKMKVGFKVED